MIPTPESRKPFVFTQSLCKIPVTIQPGPFSVDVTSALPFSRGYYYVKFAVGDTEDNCADQELRSVATVDSHGIALTTCRANLGGFCTLII